MSSGYSTVRKSVALPRETVENAIRFAPKELKNNFNRLVLTALEEFAGHRRSLSFEQEMAAMAADPAIKADCAAISKDFVVADMDGLKK